MTSPFINVQTPCFGGRCLRTISMSHRGSVSGNTLSDRRAFSSVFPDEMIEGENNGVDSQDLQGRCNQPA
jgi:hypothetical protein